MDLNKFLKYFGMLFVVIGMVAGILFIGGALMTRSFPLIFMGVMFPLIFCGVGGFFAWIGGSALKRVSIRISILRRSGLRSAHPVPHAVRR